MPRDMSAHQLRREFPDIRRPTSSPDDPEYVAEVAAALGNFVLWLHDQWPALVDRLDSLESKIDEVDRMCAHFLRVQSAADQKLEQILRRLDK